MAVPCNAGHPSIVASTVTGILDIFIIIIDYEQESTSIYVEIWLLWYNILPARPGTSK